MEAHTAHVIVIGDEILRGQIVDTNSSYLAKKLRAAGIKLRKITVIPDIVCTNLLLLLLIIFRYNKQN